MPKLYPLISKRKVTSVNLPVHLLNELENKGIVKRTILNSGKEGLSGLNEFVISAIESKLRSIRQHERGRKGRSDMD